MLVAGGVYRYIFVQMLDIFCDSMSDVVADLHPHMYVFSPVISSLGFALLRGVSSPVATFFSFFFLFSSSSI